MTPDEVSRHLKIITDDAKAKRPINWAVVEKLITGSRSRQHHAEPAWYPRRRNHWGVGTKHRNKYDGMCPDIRLYDFECSVKP